MVKRLCVVVALFTMPALLFAAPELPPCTAGSESGLPLPSTFEKNPAAYQNLLEGGQKLVWPASYQAILGKFLEGYVYDTKLGWCHDESVRDTGPYVNGAYYGTHPAVRIWYSPNAAKWVLNGRKGDIPDGAMIIKEQFKPPAYQYNGWTDAQLRTFFSQSYDWTFMIRDRNGSADGWYWGEIWKGQSLDSYDPPFAIFNTGFGLYCSRCHASAASLMTFADKRNVKGQHGEPLTFYDDLSWFPAGAVQRPTQILEATPKETAAHPHVSAANLARLTVPHLKISGDWAKFFQGTTVNPPDPKKLDLPGENYDHVVAPPGKPRLYMTSDQCFGCHGGGSYGNNLLMPDDRLITKPLVNVSPYAEWRWSPMGLAGRDPVFYSQLESEIAFLDAKAPQAKNSVVNLCFSCHNAMGQRQLEVDTGSAAYTTEYPKITDLADPRFEYGALGRDGISCAVCHHIKSTESKTEMQFIAEDAAGCFANTAADQLEGPFDKPVTIPMHNTLGVDPVHDGYTQNGRMCGTCHTIPLPVLDAPASTKHAAVKKCQSEQCQTEDCSYEQATYLEWVNSAYQNVVQPAQQGNVRTCQDCHMTGALNGTPIQSQIAAVQDAKYPAADNLAPGAADVPIRTSGYARHQFQGLNVFLLAMFDQYNELLGVRKCDYMASGCSDTNPKSGIPFAQRNFLDQAAAQTATIDVKSSIQGSTLTADVTITNLTGHRFPSGVSFRRAFIDFRVVNATTNQTLFESGQTSSIGAIVDMKGNVLPSEYIGSTGPHGHDSQPHFWSPGKPITSDQQVQIYEELLKNADGNFTTSFIRQDEHFKDNRILPFGWRKDGPNLEQFFGKPLEATSPHGTGADPHYSDPLGAKGESVVRYAVTLPPNTDPASVVVTAKLYYQAISPYFLLQRFQQAPDGVGTQRLYYITSQLDTSKTPFPGWKLLVAQAEATP